MIHRKIGNVKIILTKKRFWDNITVLLDNAVMPNRLTNKFEVNL